MAKGVQLKNIGGCMVILKINNREIREMIAKSSVGKANKIASMPKHELKGGSCDTIKNSVGGALMSSNVVN